MPYVNNSFEDSASLFRNNEPTNVLQRIGYVKQLIFSKTKLEFRLIWNKIFQKDDDELGWLLNPYSRSSKRADATMMSDFHRNLDESYQYSYDAAATSFGREKVSIYNKGLVKRRKLKKTKEPKKTFKENALDIARYMGLGVYMTTTTFPSPFYPVNESHIKFGGTAYESAHNVYSMSKIW